MPSMNDYQILVSAWKHRTTADGHLLTPKGSKNYLVFVHTSDMDKNKVVTLLDMVKTGYVVADVDNADELSFYYLHNDYILHGVWYKSQGIILLRVTIPTVKGL